MRDSKLFTFRHLNCRLSISSQQFLLANSLPSEAETRVHGSFESSLVCLQSFGLNEWHVLFVFRSFLFERLFQKCIYYPGHDFRFIHMDMMTALDLMQLKVGVVLLEDLEDSLEDVLGHEESRVGSLDDQVGTVHFGSEMFSLKQIEI